MTFVSASILPGGYKNITNPDGTPQSIQITGAIYDSEISQPWIGTYWIEGATLAGLPSASHNPDQPGDPRYNAIMGLVAQFIKTTHQAWYSASVQPPSMSFRDTSTLPILTSGSVPGIL